MRYGLFVVQLANGRRNEHCGRWVRSFRADRGNVYRGVLQTTPHASEALTFETHAEAHAFWTQTSPAEPVRPWDGKPNRPMTGYWVLIEEIDEGRTVPAGEAGSS